MFGSLYCLALVASLPSGKEAARKRRWQAGQGDTKRYLIASWISGALRRAAAGSDSQGGVIMGAWFWLNMPLALLFVCCWAGIPLWLTFTRWNAEINAKYAVIAAKASPAPVFAPPAPAVAHETGSPAYAGVPTRSRP